MIFRSALVATTIMVIGIGLASGGTGSRTYFINSKTLYDWCKSPGKQGQETCSAYIAGVHDALNSRDIKRDLKLISKCNGKRFQLKQVNRAIVETMQTSPVARSERGLAYRNVLSALSVDICEDTKAVFKSIRKQLGPVPRQGTQEYTWYRKLHLCMYMLEFSRDKCVAMLQKGLL